MLNRRQRCLMRRYYTDLEPFPELRFRRFDSATEPAEIIIGTHGHPQPDYTAECHLSILIQSAF